MEENGSPQHGRQYPRGRARPSQTVLSKNQAIGISNDACGLERKGSIPCLTRAMSSVVRCSVVKYSSVKTPLQTSIIEAKMSCSYASMGH